ncbi:MAG: CPXCG motif-containing cysteine-rich protein [Pseudomonadota bacterium]
MDASLIDRRITCPYCGETIDIVLDISAGGQSYIEDCQVCCQPIEISFEVGDESLTGITVHSAH